MAYHLVPAADITHVHADSTDQQYHAQITALADGGALVVFEQNVANPVDGWDAEITAQRYDAQGNPVGGPVVIDRVEGVSLVYSNPVVTGLEGGGYAIAWHDRDTSDIRVQTFGTDGALLNDVIVSLPDRYLDSRDDYVAVTGSNGSAVLTALQGGGFALAMDADYPGLLAQYSGASTIYTQTFDQGGVAVSGPVQVTPWVGNVSYGQDLPSYTSDVTALDNGTYLVVMRGGEGAPGNDSDHPAVLGRIYSAAGVPVGDSFMISQTTDAWADLGSVAVLDNGDFVVAWRGEDSGYWRRFTDDGTPVTEATALGSYYVDVRATATPDGGFLITAMYSGYNPAYTTYGYRFDADNHLVDDRFVLTESRVPDYDTTYYAFPPEFAVLGNDQLLALVEGHASWNGNDWEVMAWRQLAEELGSAGDDTMTAGTDGMALFGRAGQDTLLGSAARDYLDGGEGHDSLTGGDGADTLNAGAGDDTLDGGLGDDTLIAAAGAGNGTVRGGAGQDTLIFDGVRLEDVTAVRGPSDALEIDINGTTTLVQGIESFEFHGSSFQDVRTLEELLPERNSTIYGTDGEDSLLGGYGDDRLVAYDGNDLADGGDGNDRVLGYGGDDTLLGGLGNDTIEGSDGADVLQGQTGDDSLRGGNHDDTLIGGDGNDTLNGDSGNDLMQGEGGNDTFTVYYGADTVSGGDGTDRAVFSADSSTIVSVSGPETVLSVRTGWGTTVFDGVEEFVFTDTTLSLSQILALRNLELTGTAGDDALTGDYGADTLMGGDGNDRLDGGVGDDSLRGGDGNDTLIGSDGNDVLIGGDTEADLRDVIYGGDGHDSIDGGYGNDELRGDGGNDTISGGFGTDTVIGGAGDDVLTGEAWSDMLYGNDGNDFINGGFGYDRMNGAAGADRFFHLGIADHGSDWVQDYTAADGDVLVFGQTSATADQFQVNFTETANAGVAGVAEAFVIYRPTGQIMWALVDGAAQAEINLVIAGVEYDLLM